MDISEPLNGEHMFDILIVDKDMKRAADIKQLLAVKHWQAKIFKDIQSDSQFLSTFSGMILVLDQGEQSAQAIIDNKNGFYPRVILTNVAIKKSLHDNDQIFYVTQVQPLAALIKQIEALIEVIDSQQLLPVAVDPNSKQLLGTLQKFARSYAPVLIYGETGVGKEVIARYIHHHSLCSNGPFVALNCAALPEQMIEAILFGYEKGAFTGAIAPYAGKFEQAQEGTLLLDEISELPLLLQSKILRALQEKEIERLGGKKTIKINARIIAATNQNLMSLVDQGKFRKDLYYRLNVLPVNCKALRDRKLDILPLCRLFIKKYCYQLNRKPLALHADAEDKLYQYAWPGNVRELENTIHRAVIMCEHDIIDQADIVLDEIQQPEVIKKTMLKDGCTSKFVASEAEVIIATLQLASGCKQKAANLLNISPRTLRYKIARLREHGVQIP